MNERKERIGKLWHIGTYGFSDEVKGYGDEMVKWLRALNNDVSSYLFGDSNVPPKEDCLRNMAKMIMKQFPPLRKSSQCTYILSAVVNRGNEEGLYDLCPPPISIYVKRDPSPFLRDKHLSLLEQVTVWHECLKRSVTDGCANEPWKIQVGQVIASAALHGGLCDHSLLFAFYQKLSGQIQVKEKTAYFDFNLPWHGQPGQEFRRWFPDPLTEILFLLLSQETIRILQERYDTKKISIDDVFSCLNEFFKKKLPDKSQRPKSVAKFVKAILYKMQTKLPMFLVSYASRKFSNHSLKPTVWRRIHSKTIEIIPSEPEKEEKADALFAEYKTKYDALLPRWFKDLVLHLRLTTSDMAKFHIVRLCSKYPNSNEEYSPRALFSGWALCMIEKGSASGNKLALSTIRGYFSQIGQRVIGHSAQVELTKLSLDGYQEIYTQILEDAVSKNQRVKLAKGLREFHYYLTKEFSVEPINNTEALGLGATLSPVDANLITPDEFKAILASPIIRDLEIEKSKFDDSDYNTIARLVLILAFRCGMRRMEILGLEVRDFLDADPCELLIRPHAHRSLKTKSSNRKMPLYALMPKEELDELILWKKKRANEIAGKSGPHFLFAIAKFGGQAVSAYSRPSRPVIPREAGHPFHFIPATNSI